MSRLPSPFGSRIDRLRPVRFTFEGSAYEGFEGDCIASALAASNRWMISRSFKYHRPRGVFSMAGAEANTLVQLPGEPNVLADRTALSDGMALTAQNVNGSLENDRDAVMDRLGRFLPVGFYYRTFMGPSRQSWFKLWEPLIRRKAGLGAVDTKVPPRHFDASQLHCDVLVVGAGQAGLEAAIEAGEAGADVVLCDENPEIGGWLTHGRCDPAVLAGLAARLRALPNVRVMTDTVCNGWYEDNWLPLISGDHLYRTRAREVVIATGRIGQPAIFRNNDLPGIMLGSAAQRLMRHYGVRPGKVAVVLAASDEGYDVALDLTDAGIIVALVVDPRPRGAGGAKAEAVRGAGLTIINDTSIDGAQPRSDRKHLGSVEVAGRRIACDLLAMTADAAPAWQLPCQAGGRIAFDAGGALRIMMPEGPVRLVGGVDEPFDLTEGAASGGSVKASDKGRDFVDFDEDLQVKDLQNAVKEGYREIELVKRFTTVGMGPSQGRHSALATAGIVAAATGRTLGEVGVTTARPPVGPETLGVLAGHHEPLERRTSLHARHLALGALMKPVGAWWRPFHYGRREDEARAVREEIMAVRQGAGLLDVSTLGKLELRGPDAGAFLDRIYTMAHASQPVGRVRYCLMLNEMGSVVDDGVAYRMAQDRFYVTATTGAVARVYADMLFWNAQWRMKVDILNLTGAFCGLNVTGPKAREIVETLEGTIDFSKEAFPYLSGAEGVVAGVPVRAMRIGFTGELSFELHCASSLAPALWDALMAAGKPHGLRPYGLEASRILRLEKGHILIGQDTDAVTTPDELGFGWAVSKKKPFFIGKRSIEMRARNGLTRRLVGLRFPGVTTLPGESCLVLRQGAPVGAITSIGHSPTLGETIALAYVHPDDAAEGSRVTIKGRDGRMVEASVAGHAFFDPANARQEM